LKRLLFLQVHQRPRLVFGLENSSTVVQFDKSSTTKNRFSSPSIIKPRTILPNVKSSSHFRSPLGISSNHEKIESTSTVITTSKRHRKPAKKFDDFVVENPIRNLISEMKRAGHQDEMRYALKFNKILTKLCWKLSILDCFFNLSGVWLKAATISLQKINYPFTCPATSNERRMGTRLLQSSSFPVQNVETNFLIGETVLCIYGGLIR